MIKQAGAVLFAAAIAIGSASAANAASLTKIADHGPVFEEMAPPVQHVPKKLTGADIIEINFTVRTFMWAIDHRQAELLLRTTDAETQAQFPNSAAFLAVLIRAHALLDDISDVFMPRPSLVDGQTTQTVFFKDARGGSWKATYLLKKQADDRFAVAKCHFQRYAGKLA